MYQLYATRPIFGEANAAGFALTQGPSPKQAIESSPIAIIKPAESILLDERLNISFIFVGNPNLVLFSKKDTSNVIVDKGLDL
jgi:hypothetical protein